MGAGTAAAATMALRDSWEGVGLALRDAGQAMTELQQLYSVARGAILPVVQSIADFHVRVFRMAFGGIAESFSGVWSGITAQVSAFFAGIGQRLSGLADAVGLTDLARRVSSATADAGARIDYLQRSTAIGRIASMGVDLSGGAVGAAGLLAEWRDILGSRPTAATTPAAAPARTVTNNRTNNTTINVSGAGDPGAVADEVARRQREVADADHPVGAEE
jgi:hypothetical protein